MSLSSNGRWLAYCTQHSSLEDTATGHFYTRTGVPQGLLNCVIWVKKVGVIGEELQSASRCLTHGWGSSWAPTWSPDGTRLAFFSDKGGTPLLYIWNRRTDRIQSFPGAIVRDILGNVGPIWSSDGTRVFYKALPPGRHLNLEAPQISGPPKRTSAESKTLVQVLSSLTKVPRALDTDISSEDSYVVEPTDIAMADLLSGQVFRLRHGVGIRSLLLSPNGKHLAEMENCRNERLDAIQNVFDLYVVPVPDEGVRPRGTDISNPGLKPLVARIRQGWGVCVSWSPGSDRLAYVTDGSLSNGGIYVVSASGGMPRDITAHEQAESSLGDSISDLSNRHAARAKYDGTYIPIWTSDGKALLCTGRGHLWRISVLDGSAKDLTPDLSGKVVCIVAPRGRQSQWTVKADQVLVRTSDELHDRMGFCLVNISTGVSTQLINEPKTYENPTDAAAHTGTVIYSADDRSSPGDLWAFNAFSNRSIPRRVTDINPQLAGIRFPCPQTLSWNTADGSPNKGLLFLPPGASPDCKVPLIVFFYPGELFSDAENRFDCGWAGTDWRPSFYTDRGYALLLPDCPLHTDEPAQEIAGDILPGIKAAITTGRIDPANIGVMGQSYGGYGVAVLITHTTLFKAAVDCDGLCDLPRLALSGNFWYTEDGQARMNASLWQSPERYIRNSPIFMLDKVDTPILLIYGEDDWLLDQGRETYNGLVRLGKEVELATYAGGDHYWGSWSASQQVDFWNRVFSWYDSHLKNGIKGAAMAEEAK